MTDVNAVLTPEREAQLVERLHKAWHPAPNACTPNRPCYERRRARGVARILGPVVSTWLIEDLERAKAELVDLWDEPDRTRDLSGERVGR